MRPSPRRAGNPSAPAMFARGSWPEARRIADVLRKETVGGALLLAATVLALAWANSPWAGFHVSLRDARLDPLGCTWT